MLKSLRNIESPVVLGILGGGQLAKMLCQAAYRLGINVAVIESGANSPAGDMTKADFPGGWNDDAELHRFLDACDIVTLENEFIDPSVLEIVESKRKLFPCSQTMRLVQDKFHQKDTFRKAGLSVPDFDAIEDLNKLIRFSREFSFPFVLKARTHGYDGYGNATIFNEDEIETSWNFFQKNQTKREMLAERFIKFQKELAVLVARNESGEIMVYPCVETIQYRHICHAVIAPAEISNEISKMAQDIAVAAVESINGVGIFGVELFLTEDNKILINEIAPRPHNSGHYTIEACYTSQFENCIRAVCNLPLGSSKMIKPGAAMVNLLGTRDGSGVPTNLTEFFRHREVWLHLYNKKQSRNGRKMGHVTALGDSPNEAFNRARAAAESVIW
ncbi:MAG: 5-(carboxyamino)imidazole ribonucleotide synthase [Candidatus Kapabacteria bacterium]|nr:5-(carboxyamino)imidazole ribonucleotide synthase [Candidatus Kapabacteria bacterium]